MPRYYYQVDGWPYHVFTRSEPRQEFLNNLKRYHNWIEVSAKCVKRIYGGHFERYAHGSLWRLNALDIRDGKIYQLFGY